MSDTTEIQKIPGKFNLPAGWPRLVIPDLTSALLADWRADDLPTGTLAATGWKSSSGTAADPLRLAPAETRAWPVVGQDSNGNKYVRFVNSYLEAAVEWNGPVTVLAVFRPAADASGVQRIFSGPTAGFRSLARQGGQFVMGLTGHSKALNSAVTAGELTMVAARYGLSEIDGIQHGKPWSVVQAITGGYPKQSSVSVGSNMAPAGSEGFLKGDLYRLQVWGRVLSKEDTEAALQSNANLYNIY